MNLQLNFDNSTNAQGSTSAPIAGYAVLPAGVLGPEFIDTSNRADQRHYWLMPPDKLKPLQDEFNFDFDPCPFPKPEDFDGLTCEWGQSSYVNPPFGSVMHQGKKKGPTAWARKAIAENQKGKGVVLVYPIDKWVLMLLAAGAKVRNLGDVRWLATEDGSQGKGTGRHIACFVLDPAEGSNAPHEGPCAASSRTVPLDAVVVRQTGTNDERSFRT